MDAGEISNCISNISGGGIYNECEGSIVNFSGGTITECKSMNGGGVYNKYDVEVVINGGTISNCTAGNKGGVSWEYDGKKAEISFDGNYSGDGSYKFGIIVPAELAVYCFRCNRK